LWLHSLASSVVENHRTPTISALLNRGHSEEKVDEFAVPLCREHQGALHRRGDEARSWVCAKRLVVMIPTLLPALERHGRLKLDEADRERVLAISAATIDRQLGPTKRPS
jgi:hypothetical protein